MLVAHHGSSETAGVDDCMERRNHVTVTLAGGTGGAGDVRQAAGRGRRRRQTADVTSWQPPAGVTAATT